VNLVLRSMLFPSEISVLTLIGILLFGLTYQTLTNAATFYLISYVEHIRLEEFVMPHKSVKDVAWDLFFVTVCSLFCLWFNALLSLSLWSPQLTHAELKP